MQVMGWVETFDFIRQLDNLFSIGVAVLNSINLSDDTP
jgi:hypothetical protein